MNIGLGAIQPAGICDAHMHFYKAGAHSGDTPFVVPQATVGDYRRLMHRLGISKVVIVQSMLYGADNQAMLDALAELGVECARGIAVTKADASDALWDDLEAQGVKGLRAFMLPGGVFSWNELPRLGGRLADRGWQLHLQLDGRELPKRAAVLSALPCPLVIDHVGKFLTPVAPDDAAFLALLRLVEKGNSWVKISGFYETSVSGGPDYDDVANLARIIIDTAPERVLWASNWPHPNGRPAPDDGALLELALRLAPDERTAAKLFRENAVDLFGFGPSAASPGLQTEGTVQ